ncbi:MAG TPA: bifunctional DNA-formamidopyrimidine glycosylase/DNA-(apurinic or apyrimidinic site) lyase [Candidatus Acidoferrales bacterium]|nr:bifunctional DNA-formamidopyrimidine glycosylase/DNA-(apurinic or apyrimidinic site) lyase [Candidatus Acidoferrales bacterium]
MPELPEVETIVRGLRAAVSKRKIMSVRLGKTDFIVEPAALAERLPGSRIAAVERYGKFISLTLEPAGGTPRFYFMIHLGMTGQIIPRASSAPIVPHTHVFLELDDGRELRYTDIRRFGQMFLLPESGIAQFRTKLGTDPLDITSREFVKRFRSRRARIKALLVDQRVLRGMGNIYADESLWRARIHPEKIAATLKPAQLIALHRAVRRVLEDAIRLKGSSISDFLDAEGRRGEYQLHHRVYGRAGKSCSRCKTTIRRIVVAGRGSYFCPRCQASPRPASRRQPKR